MLLIGTVISLLTAVAATRAMLGLLSGFRWFDNPRFMGAHGQQTAPLAADRLHEARATVVRALRRRDPRRRRLARRPRPQPRHRLQGRHAVHVQDAQVATSQADVAPVAAKPGHARRHRPGPRHVGRTASYKEWQIRTKSLTGREQAALNAGPRAATSAPTELGVKNVSASFGHQIAIDAICGILVSLAPDRRLHHAALRPQVRGAGDPRDAARHRRSRSASTRSSTRRSRSRRSPRC